MPKLITVNQQFFDNWSNAMAYVLGFFAADGCLTINPRGAHYLEFISTDADVLFKIRGAMQSQNKIACYHKMNPNWKTVYRLQIGSKYMFSRLEGLGFMVRKSLILQFPPVPNKFLSHFVRGYFDGDGCIQEHAYPRKNRNNKLYVHISLRFTSGSFNFLQTLFGRLKQIELVTTGGIYKKPRGGYDLRFSKFASLRIGRWMYQNHDGLFMDRKYQKFKIILGT